MPITDPQEQVEFARKAMEDKSLPKALRERYAKVVEHATVADLYRGAIARKKARETRT